MGEAEKILIIGPAWVGDMVMTQSLAMVLRARDPAAVVDIVGPPWSVPLVRRFAGRLCLNAQVMRPGSVEEGDAVVLR